MKMDLSDKTAVVTGGSSGIGKALALELARYRARLYIVGRKSEALNEVGSAVKGQASWVRACQVDLTVDREVDLFAKQVADEFGGLDLLIHSAGLFARGSWEASPIEELDRLYRINLRARCLLTQRLLPLLKQRQGQIVFINSSAAALRAHGQTGLYVATMHAGRALADSLRDEVNTAGVRVLEVFVGRTATPMQAKVHELEGKTYQPERLIQPEELAAMIIQTLVLQRSAEVTNLSVRPMLKT